MIEVKTPPLNGANRFAHIDAMRAFAVLLVVLAHAGLKAVIPGGSGVTIFFSISGFIITYLLLREFDRTGNFSLKGFYFRRVIKIGPPFVLIVLVPSIFLFFLGRVELSTLISQTFFFFNWSYLSGASGFLDGSDVVWSLAIEEQFYIVFAAIWVVLVKSRQRELVTCVVAGVAIIYASSARFVLAADPMASDRIYYGTDTRIDGIAWGVLAAVLIHWMQRDDLLESRGARLLSHDAILFAAIGMYIFSLLYRDDFFRDTFRYSLQSLAACLVIMYGLLSGRGAARVLFYKLSQHKLVALIGLSSYSIYLVHLVLMNLLRPWLQFPGPINVLILSVMGVAAGIAVYTIIEVPVHKWSKRRLRREAPFSVG